MLATSWALPTRGLHQQGGATRIALGCIVIISSSISNISSISSSIAFHSIAAIDLASGAGCRSVQVLQSKAGSVQTGF